VGRQGSVIKQIGTEARKKIEAMLDGQVHLNLHVKVSPKWFSNNWVLDELGLPRSQTAPRVWRSK
jgi:GTPase